jgi:hypothetical protein
MTTLSVEKLEKYLKAYSLDIEYWANDMHDSDEMLGTREILAANWDALTFAMRKTLLELDGKARALLENYRGPETWDVRMLRDLVKLADSNQRQAA